MLDTKLGFFYSLRHPFWGASSWCEGRNRTIQIQMSGGHLLAAGLDGSNTLIKSSPVAGGEIRTPFGVPLPGAEEEADGSECS